MEAEEATRRGGMLAGEGVGKSGSEIKCSEIGDKFHQFCGVSKFNVVFSSVSESDSSSSEELGVRGRVSYSGGGCISTLGIY